MKKFIAVAIVLLATSVHAAWQKPVDADVSVHYGQPVTGGTSNSTKYTAAKGQPVSAPTDGTLVRNYGLLLTYKSKDGYYWELFGVFNMFPPTAVNKGDYLGYTSGTTLYLLVSGSLAPFINNRYTPTYVKPTGVCLPVEYYNAEAF